MFWGDYGAALAIFQIFSTRPFFVGGVVKCPHLSAHGNFLLGESASGTFDSVLLWLSRRRRRRLERAVGSVGHGDGRALATRWWWRFLLLLPLLVVQADACDEANNQNENKNASAVST
jgi:hypothetical protein